MHHSWPTCMSCSKSVYCKSISLKCSRTETVKNSGKFSVAWDDQKHCERNNYTSFTVAPTLAHILPPTTY